VKIVLVTINRGKIVLASNAPVRTGRAKRVPAKTESETIVRAVNDRRTSGRENESVVLNGYARSARPSAAWTSIGL
jgi:hypothetical protein